MRVFVLFFMLFSSFLAFNQGATSFYKTYFTSPFENGQGVVQLPNGGYAVTGSSASFSGGSNQAFIMVVDELGNQVWTKAYGGNQSDWGRRIFHEPGIGYWVVGFSNSTPSGNFDVYMFQTDEAGELLWEKHFETNNWERVWDAKRLSNGDFIIVGETEGSTTNNKDGFMMRVDDTGESIWYNEISTSEDDIIYAVDVQNDSLFWVGGKSTNLLDETSAIISQYHINGTEEITSFWDQSGGVGVIRDLFFYDGQIYAAGGIQSSGNDYLNNWLVRSDLNGDIIDEFSQNYQDDDYASNIAVLGFNRVYWSHWTSSPDGNVYPGGPDLILLKFTSNLYFFNFSMSFSGYDPDECHQIIPTSDGGLLMVGFVSDEKEFFSEGTHVVLIKVGPNDEVDPNRTFGDDLVSTIENENFNQEYLVYPVPFGDEINFSSNLENAAFKVFDISGRQVENGIANNGTINLSKLNSGAYYIHFQTKQGNVIRKIIKD